MVGSKRCQSVKRDLRVSRFDRVPAQAIRVRAQWRSRDVDIQTLADEAAFLATGRVGYPASLPGK